MGVVEACWFKKKQNRVSRVSLGWSQHTNRVGVGATGICRHVGGHLPHLGLRNIPTGGCFSRCGVPSAPPLTPQAFSEAPGESEEAPRPPRTKLSSPLSRAGLSVLSAPCSEEEASLPRLPRPCLCPASSLGSLLGPPGGPRVVLDKCWFSEMRATLYTISAGEGGHPAWQFCHRAVGTCQNWRGELISSSLCLHVGGFEGPEWPHVL